MKAVSSIYGGQQPLSSFFSLPKASSSRTSKENRPSARATSTSGNGKGTGKRGVEEETASSNKKAKLRHEPPPTQVRRQLALEEIVLAPSRKQETGKATRLRHSKGRSLDANGKAAESHDSLPTPPMSSRPSRQGLIRSSPASRKRQSSRNSAFPFAASSHNNVPSPSRLMMESISPTSMRRPVLPMPITPMDTPIPSIDPFVPSSQATMDSSPVRLPPFSDHQRPTEALSSPEFVLPSPPIRRSSAEYPSTTIGRIEQASSPPTAGITKLRASPKVPVISSQSQYLYPLNLSPTMPPRPPLRSASPIKSTGPGWIHGDIITSQTQYLVPLQNPSPPMRGRIRSTVKPEPQPVGLEKLAMPPPSVIPSTSDEVVPSSQSQTEKSMTDPTDCDMINSTWSMSSRKGPETSVAHCPRAPASYRAVGDGNSVLLTPKRDRRQPVPLSSCQSDNEDSGEVVSTSSHRQDVPSAESPIVPSSREEVETRSHHHPSMPKYRTANNLALGLTSVSSTARTQHREKSSSPIPATPSDRAQSAASSPLAVKGGSAVIYHRRSQITSRASDKDSSTESETDEEHQDVQSSQSQDVDEALAEGTFQRTAQYSPSDEDLYSLGAGVSIPPDDVLGSMTQSMAPEGSEPTQLRTFLNMFQGDGSLPDDFPESLR